MFTPIVAYSDGRYAHPLLMPLLVAVDEYHGAVGTYAAAPKAKKTPNCKHLACPGPKGVRCMGKGGKCKGEATENTKAGVEKIKGGSKEKATDVKSRIDPLLHDFHDFATSDKELTAAEKKKVANLVRADDLDSFQSAKVDKLTKDGIDPVEAAAFEGFIGGSYGDMNSAIWNASVEKETDPKAWGEQMLVNKAAVAAMRKIPPVTAESIQSTIDELAEGNAKGWTPNKPLIRHEGVEDFDSYVKGYQESLNGGKPHVSATFWSTTWNQEGEPTFKDNSNIEINIKPKLDGSGNGVIVDKYKNKAYESEVLYRPMTQFKVAAVEVIPEKTIKKSRFVPTKQANLQDNVETAYSKADQLSKFGSGSFSANFKKEMISRGITVPKEFTGGKTSVTKKQAKTFLDSLAKHKGAGKDVEYEEIQPKSAKITLEEI